MAKKQEIVSEMRTIHDLLLNNSTSFLIPFFQRDFVWEKEDVRQLFCDIENDSENMRVVMLKMYRKRRK